MDRILDLVTRNPLPSLPRTLRLAWESAQHSYRQDPRLRPERHVALQITLSGYGHVWQDGRCVAVPRGSALLFITRETPLLYGLGTSPAWEFAYANLAGETCLQIAGDLLRRHGPVQPLAADHPVVGDLLRRLPAKGAAAQTISPAESARIAWELMAALLDRTLPDQDADLSSRAMAWLRPRLAEPVGIAEAAAALSVSREHLTRAFTARAGQPPASWLREQRLKRAEALLADPTLGVAAVAQGCGFASPSHFCAAFRKRYGSTPAAWRMHSGTAQSP
jgi:AraC-like DNA-binding protein